MPASSVARVTEATFVIRIRDGNTEWVNVQTGEQDGKSIEVFGGLREGDEVAVRGTDELRSGSHVTGMTVDSVHHRAFLLYAGNRTFTVFALELRFFSSNWGAYFSNVSTSIW